MKMLIGLVVAGCCAFAAAATPQVKNVKAMQQYPWGKVYITYEVVGDVTSSAGSGKTPFLLVTAKDKTSGRVYEATHLSGDTGTTVGLHRVIWDVATQGVTINSANMVFTVAYCDELYLVVDLSSGANSASYPIAHLYAVPSGGWTDVYKTTKLVLRRIMPGSFKMGGQYNVILTKSFYMGIFEMTQKQYELVMGTKPSSGITGDNRPVVEVSYNMIRGSENGAQWPSSSAVDLTSFMGKLQTRTGLNFDLPTEAQWEYACRAGTTSDYNNGGNTENDLKLLGRYGGNQTDGKGGYSSGTTAVGSYMSNAWGLYDMHGNVWEWCLDWAGDLSSGVTDPVGVSSGSQRVVRSSAYFQSFSSTFTNPTRTELNHTSSVRRRLTPSSQHGVGYGGFGFRICCLAY
ncbi:MAG: SUMF1/EgtB/PvdO family nonheme iron enzyme [Kiritimatiellae bacterium]|nr:SUMF1/EgtB/PvdO family nonheme iron enzyme [Kiritimatiellia bacterium]